ncbi:MAG TPA: HisA/HisF-related TIM barrel protein [Gemmatimonadales bacterium]|nr:HisA/HisF-related TIM barrel protein [Gemmatimonadales bacterium]
MELIPVLDLSHGRAVHARGGVRAEYRPVRSVLMPGQPGDALLLARRYRERLGARRCYVADLDALTGHAPQRELLRALADPAAGFGGGLLVDAGVREPSAAAEVLELGAAAVVIALETLPGPEMLSELIAAVGAERALLSLDLRDGRPVVAPESRWPDGVGAVEMADRCVQRGVRHLLVLDLARVGRSAGPPLEAVAAIRGRHAGLEILAGGGVRGPADLAALAAQGASGALVATALHEGRLG